MQRIPLLLGLILCLSSTTARVAVAQPVPPPEPEPAPASGPAPAPPSGARVELELATGDPAAPPAPSTHAERSFGHFGLGGTVTHVETNAPRGPERGTWGSALIGSSTLSYESDGWFSARSRGFAHIGGGSAGLEGDLGGFLALGVRVPIGDYHGPFVRISGAGELRGNDQLYWSRISLPGVEAGYQWLMNDSLLEVAFTSGVVLAGHYHLVSRGYRDITHSKELGALLSIGFGPAQLQISYTQLTDGSHTPDSALSLGEAALCAHLGDALQACLDGARWSGEQRTRGGPGVLDADVTYVALRIGYGTELPAPLPGEGDPEPRGD